MNAKLSHDIKNQLTVIYALAVKLQKPMDDAPRVELVNKIKSRISDIVKILDGKIDIQRELDLGPIFEEFNNLIDVKVTNTDEVKVKANKAKISAQINNMVKNATEAGATKLNVQITNRFIALRDNGEGFAAHIIDKFYSNIRATTKADGNGFGLLSIKDYFKKIGYKMDISNELTKKGSLILFTKNKPRR